MLWRILRNARKSCIMLSFSEYGTATDAPALLIVHGLYGSGRNWGVIAKRLSDNRKVITVDMRNHGDSPRADSQSYEDMASDLAEVIRHIGAPMDVCGHSMGGKASMVLALQHPDLVSRLIVADIAPVAYEHSQQEFIDAMRKVDLATVTRRSDAQEQLAAAGVEPALQSFFTQSIDIASKTWKLNLDVLEAEMPKIVGWPSHIVGPFDGPAFFLSGGTSDYVLSSHRPAIKGLFPNAYFAKLPGVGHWLHAENPRDFEASVRAFLGQS
jgi:pimeloyl-ACP methyl ester carboxylesterase